MGRPTDLGRSSASGRRAPSTRARSTAESPRPAARPRPGIACSGTLVQSLRRLGRMSKDEQVSDCVTQTARGGRAAAHRRRRTHAPPSSAPRRAGRGAGRARPRRGLFDQEGVSLRHDRLRNRKRATGSERTVLDRPRKGGRRWARGDGAGCRLDRADRRGSARRSLLLGDGARDSCARCTACSGYASRRNEGAGCRGRAGRRKGAGRVPPDGDTSCGADCWPSTRSGSGGQGAQPCSGGRDGHASALCG